MDFDRIQSKRNKFVGTKIRVAQTHKLILCCCYKKRYRQRQQVNKFEHTIKQQLDILKMVKRQRMLLLTMLTSLSLPQREIIKRMSTLKMQESSNDDASDDFIFSEIAVLNRIASGQDPVDKRLAFLTHQGSNQVRHDLKQTQPLSDSSRQTQLMRPVNITDGEVMSFQSSLESHPVD